MPPIVQITPGFAVTGQLAPEDFARLSDLGFRGVINNRPDGEEPGQIAAEEAERLAEQFHLTYRHIPATKLDLFTDDVVDAMAEALQEHGPWLAFCRTGQRSAIVWAAATARTQPVERVLERLADAGLDLAFLRDDLDSQADRVRWMSPAPKRRPSSVVIGKSA